MGLLTTPALNRLTNVRSLALPEHSREDGSVVVAEALVHVPFPIARMFTLQAPAGARRGNHAHRLCWQFFLCVNGAVDVICDDGDSQQTFTLDRGNLALIVPPTIWNSVVFQKPQSSVVVLCDRGYEAQDYLHDYDQFLAFRKNARL
jgi:UDP-2-acetamido-3-amino-2,3-dideoxy-glucuronate N-acetyltransferase